MSQSWEHGEGVCWKKLTVFGGKAIEVQRAQSCESCSYREVLFSQGAGYEVGEAPLRWRIYDLLKQKWNGHKQQAGREQNTEKGETTEVWKWRNYR